MVDQPQQIGPYSIVREIGRGGMGVVHLARDSRLDRMVALKALPEHLAQDADRLARFEREAKILAQLQHPNLAGIHGLEEHEGNRYLVLEYVEGVTLSERLDRGALPVDEALELCAQIAAGVESAHEAGVIHRDLKPGNVIITPDSKAKVLDFGLAKVSEHTSSTGSGSSEMPTMSVPATPVNTTSPGAVMGTAPYMSPEQARGRRVDKRTDVWSFGCVLYECLTGIGPFVGETTTDTIGAILHKDIDFDALPNATPVRVHELLVRMLQRDREKRLRDLGDAMLELEAARGEGGAVAGSALRSSTWALWSSLIVIVAIAAVVGGWAIGRSGADAGQSVLPPFTLTQVTDFAGMEAYPSLSPDGTIVIYSSPRDGDWDIYSQRVGGFNAINLTASSEANEIAPALSPDGQRIAFQRVGSDEGIFIMGATGESPRRLTDFGADVSWSPDGRTLVFATEAIRNPLSRLTTSQLWTVDVASGETKKIFDGDAVQPAFSPSGERIAYWALRGGGNRDVFTITADGQDPVAVTSVKETDWNPAWSVDGRLLYFNSDRSGGRSLWRVSIDQSTGERLGEPERVTTGAAMATVCASFSADGSRMAYTALATRYEIRRLDLNEDRTARVGAPQTLTPFTTNAAAPGVSPDGQFVAYHSLGDQREDLFLINIDGTGRRRLTSDAAKDRGANWKPDGTAITFYTDRSGIYEIWSIRPDGSQLERTSMANQSLLSPVWSPDGLQIAAIGGTENAKIIRFENGEATATDLPPYGDIRTLLGNSWSPDNKSLACLVSIYGISRELVLLSLESMEYRSVLQHPDIRGVHWFPDGERLLVVLGQRITVVTVSTGEITDIYTEPIDTISDDGLDMAPDGSFLLYAVSVTNSDIWMMEFDQSRQP